MDDVAANDMTISSSSFPVVDSLSFCRRMYRSYIPYSARRRSLYGLLARCASPLERGLRGFFSPTSGMDRWISRDFIFPLSSFLALSRDFIFPLSSFLAIGNLFPLAASRSVGCSDALGPALRADASGASYVGRCRESATASHGPERCDGSESSSGDCPGTSVSEVSVGAFSCSGSRALYPRGHSKAAMVTEPLRASDRPGPDRRRCRAVSPRWMHSAEIPETLGENRSEGRLHNQLVDTGLAPDEPPKKPDCRQVPSSIRCDPVPSAGRPYADAMACEERSPDARDLTHRPLCGMASNHPDFSYLAENSLASRPSVWSCVCSPGPVIVRSCQIMSFAAAASQGGDSLATPEPTEECPPAPARASCLVDHSRPLRYKARKARLVVNVDEPRLEDRPSVVPCIGLCWKREEPANCESCLRQVAENRKKQGVPRDAPQPPVRFFMAVAHARMRAMSLSIEVGTSDPDAVPAQAVWGNPLVAMFDARHAVVGTGTCDQAWRCSKPTDALPTQQFLQLLETEGSRWEIFHGPNASIPSPSAGALWRGPRIIMDTGCGHSIISFSYARECGLKLYSVPQHCGQIFQGVGGVSECNTQACLPLGELRENAAFWVTEASPPLSSIGRRCVDHGHSFVWPAGGDPYFVAPWGQVIPLVVDEYIPFLHPGDSRCAPVPVERSHLEVPAPPSLLGAVARRTPDRECGPGRCFRVVPKGSVVCLEPSCSSRFCPHLPASCSPYSVPSPRSGGSPPASQLADDLAAPAPRRDLKMEALDAKHLLTHKPANPHCIACMRGKLRQVPHRSGAFRRDLERFGDIITCDHMVQMDHDWQVGLDGSRHIFVVKDLWSGLKGCYPVGRKDGDKTTESLELFCGSRVRISLCYADNAPEIVEACRRLSIPHEPSHPGVPQNNGVIERTNGDVLAMTRTVLIAAGMPTYMWPYAARCVCHNDNCDFSEASESSWYRAHNRGEFTGQLLPFGCAVWFLPATTKAKKGHGAGIVTPKWAGRAALGVFGGYVLAPGGLWTGRYLVWPLDAFAGLDLSSSANPRAEETRPIRSPHETARVDRGDLGYVFPLRDTYNWWNERLEGRAKHLGRPGPAAEPPAIDVGSFGVPPQDPEDPGAADVPAPIVVPEAVVVPVAPEVSSDPRPVADAMPPDTGGASGSGSSSEPPPPSVRDHSKAPSRDAMPRTPSDDPVVGNEECAPGSPGDPFGAEVSDVPPETPGPDMLVENLRSLPGVHVGGSDLGAPSGNAPSAGDEASGAGDRGAPLSVVPSAGDRSVPLDVVPPVSEQDSSPLSARQVPSRGQGEGLAGVPPDVAPAARDSDTAVDDGGVSSDSVPPARDSESVLANGQSDRVGPSSVVRDSAGSSDQDRPDVSPERAPRATDASNSAPVHSPSGEADKGPDASQKVPPSEPSRSEVSPAELEPAELAPAELAPADPLDRSTLMPWDPRRWSGRPILKADRVVPTLGSEGLHVLRDVNLPHTPVDEYGKYPEGTIFLGENLCRMYQDSKRAFMCDEVGRRVDKRTVLRPPSYTPQGWARIEDSVVRRKMWDRFWDGVDPPLESNLPAQPAASSEAAISGASSCIAPSPGVFVSLSSRQCSRVRRALHALQWPRSMRYNVPGDGFCIGATLTRHGPKCSMPLGRGQRECVSAVNDLIRSLGFPTFMWSSLQFNKDTDAQPHTDANNLGLSLVVILGSYTGGSLCVPELKLATPPGKSPVGLFIDGRQTHFTTPRGRGPSGNGSRFSIVAFVHSSVHDLPAAELRRLRSLGCRLPMDVGPACRDETCFSRTQEAPSVPGPVRVAAQASSPVTSQPCDRSSSDASVVPEGVCESVPASGSVRRVSNSIGPSVRTWRARSRVDILGRDACDHDGSSIRSVSRAPGVARGHDGAEISPGVSNRASGVVRGQDGAEVPSGLDVRAPGVRRSPAVAGITSHGDASRFRGSLPSVCPAGFESGSGGGLASTARDSNVRVPLPAENPPSRTTWFADAVDDESELLTRIGEASSCTEGTKVGRACFSAAAMPRMPLLPTSASSSPDLDKRSCQASPFDASLAASALDPIGFAASLVDMPFPHRHKDGGSLPFFACVARPVGRKEIEATPAAQDAMRAEWSKLASNGVFDMESVCEWAKVRAKARRDNVEVHHGSLATIVVEKGAELPLGHAGRKFKGRTVFLGDQVRNQDGQSAIFEELSSAPAAMEAGRLCDLWGCAPNNKQTTADGVQAYVQAWLQGPATWVEIPVIHWPQSWRERGLQRPVVLLKKALYGHPNAGAYWENECSDRVRGLGYESIPNWPSVFWHPIKRLLLVIYVDDFKLSGPADQHESAWREINDVIDTTEWGPVDQFLGCKQTRSEAVLADGGSAATMTYDMSNFLKQCVESYQKLTGIPSSSLRPVATPFITEDNAAQPARQPLTSGPHIECEFCRHTFPVSSAKRVPGMSPSAAAGVSDDSVRDLCRSRCDQSWTDDLFDGSLDASACRGVLGPRGVYLAGLRRSQIACSGSGSGDGGNRSSRASRRRRARIARDKALGICSTHGAPSVPFRDDWPWMCAPASSNKFPRVWRPPSHSGPSHHFVPYCVPGVRRLAQSRSAQLSSKSSHQASSPDCFGDPVSGGLGGGFDQSSSDVGPSCFASAGPLLEYEDDSGVVVCGRTRTRKGPKPKVQTVTYDPDLEAPSGQLQPVAARVLMKVLYAARVARFDLLKAVCVLATRVTKWDSSCDKRLHRLMAYINASVDKQLVGFVGDDLAEVSPHLFCDADLAGCPATQRSTSGVYQCAVGPRTRFPLAAVSKRQGSVSHSTPEAELVALDHGLRTVALPGLDVWEVISSGAALTCHEDNEVTIRVVRSGRNQTMRHLGRTHGVAISWLNETYRRGTFALRYEPSASMAADVFTKGFTNPEAWDSVCWLVSVVDASRAAEFCSRNGLPYPTSQGGAKAGIWDINPDGSGTWARVDRRATRFSSLWKTGPARAECYKRVTYDLATGKVIGTLESFDTAKLLNEELPGPVPRDTRTVFHFRATKTAISEDARKGTETVAAARPLRGVTSSWRPLLRPLA